ncbi:sigma-70 family RNA polymerase sigma factor [Maribacter sp. PR1]|uniref:Sigma-70 family RNA polymerase sigma factor n=1 Tax=Maribacter cobaltidurans TaxID=1178778 RepID=A0ABU7IVE5_9FLAO|nr:MULTISPECIES: sigma-70 family RNA polymerase sigma factor [Maribacter]MDC6389206.1 sigma-70 family RNA polymerase sigma factor [Maribacter sp. PR1]MEE1976593.1 sigma-70 family RNA polymerase sigma factor [Maribacter cobaltidurans]
MKSKLRREVDEMESLFKEHFDFLCLVSLSILKDKSTAKDVVQDFFLSFWKNREYINLSVSFKAYAIRSVKNISIQKLRQAEKEQKALKEFFPFENEDHINFQPSKRNEKLEELLNKLPEKRRKIFVSYVINGQSYAEIAENYGVSINTVKTQMKRAYHFLRSEATEDLLYIFILLFSIL